MNLLEESLPILYLLLCLLVTLWTIHTEGAVLEDIPVKSMESLLVYLPRV